MKIIGTDNFDREYINDQLICEGLTEPMAVFIVAALNEKYCKGDHAPTYYKVVSDDCKLRTFEP